MNLFDVLELIGGLALFLFGMSVMGDGLEKSAGGRLKNILEKLTSNPLRGFLLGVGVTAVIQSSSATTVMVVGFVNSGVMKLSQAIGIIMGANVGTTITSWILSLSGIQGSNLFVKLLKPSSFSPILALIGIILYLSKSGKRKDTGSILLGFAVLMFGMQTMSSAVSGLADVPEFTNILLLFSNPLLGLLTGAALTAIIQSSSASVGILQALSSTGQVTYSTAIPIILGQNIGTCVTAMLSSVGASKNARRAAVVHLYFNAIGSLTFMALFYGLNALLRFQFVALPINQFGIAVVHTSFNVLCTLVMLPFAKGLERLACMTIRDDTESEEPHTEPYLDERLMVTPSIAIGQCRTHCIKMLELTQEALVRAISSVHHYTEEEFQFVSDCEAQADHYEDQLGTYLVKLSGKSLSEEESLEISQLLYCIGDIERISDHAKAISMIARTMHQQGVTFSQPAKEEFEVLSRAVEDVVELTVNAFTQDKESLAARVEPLEQVVDKLGYRLKNRHVSRLREGSCTVEQGMLFTDLISDYSRISDHCSNIAACIVEMKHDSFGPHQYLNARKTEDALFRQEYHTLLDTYPLPQ
jgi:phosphate:Na+ symporter